MYLQALESVLLPAGAHHGLPEAGTTVFSSEVPELIRPSLGVAFNVCRKNLIRSSHLHLPSKAKAQKYR
jgi:hypothetical protein